MSITFDGKGDLTQYEVWNIAKIMHLIVLDELFRATQWTSPSAVFHGGTSLSIARNSERFSEDLDFLVDENAYQSLASNLARITKSINARVNLAIPGSKVEINGPRGKSVEAWRIRWTHPLRRNSVMVKAEFLLSTRELLENYAAQHVVPASNNLPAIVVVKTAIPVPTLLSAWADKIKAIATREEVKWRDVFDISFIKENIEATERRSFTEKISDDDRYNAIMDSANFYDFGNGDRQSSLIEGLSKLIDNNVLSRTEDFSNDMKKWLLPDSWKMYNDRNMFENMLKSVEQEVLFAKSILENNKPGMKI